MGFAFRGVSRLTVTYSIVDLLLILVVIFRLFASAGRSGWGIFLAFRVAITFHGKESTFFYIFFYGHSYEQKEAHEYANAHAYTSGD